MPVTLLDRSSKAHLRGLAEARYELDSEWLQESGLPRVSRQERERRECRRALLHDPEIGPVTLVHEGRSGEVKGYVDVVAEPCLHEPAMLLRAFGVTRLPYRQENSFSVLIDEASRRFGTSHLRTSLPGCVMAGPPAPAALWLKARGFSQRAWKHLVRVYDAEAFSVLGQAFWDVKAVPFRFGPAGELQMVLADKAHLPELTRLRLSLARSLRYNSHFEPVEMSVANLIDRPSGTPHRSSLLAVLDGGQVVGSARVTPGYSVWEGTLQLEVRDIVLADSHRQRDLLPWVFNAAVLAGRTLFHPDDTIHPATREVEPIRVETWLPTDSHVRHFKTQVPRLEETGHVCYENF